MTFDELRLRFLKVDTELQNEIFGKIRSMPTDDQAEALYILNYIRTNLKGQVAEQLNPINEAIISSVEEQRSSKKKMLNDKDILNQNRQARETTTVMNHQFLFIYLILKLP